MKKQIHCPNCPNCKRGSCHINHRPFSGIYHCKKSDLLDSLINQLEEEKEFPLGKLNSKDSAVSKDDEQFYFVWNQAIDHCIHIVKEQK